MHYKTREDRLIGGTMKVLDLLTGKEVIIGDKALYIDKLDMPYTSQNDSPRGILIEFLRNLLRQERF